jgi:hypothetical protein
MSSPEEDPTAHWHEHILNGNRSLVQNGVNVYFEVALRVQVITELLQLPSLPSPGLTLLDGLRRLNLSISTIMGLSSVDTNMVDDRLYVARIDVKDRVMRFDLDGDKYAVKQAWEKTCF